MAIESPAQQGHDPGTPAAGAPPPASTARHPGDAIRVVAGALALFVSLLAVQRDHITVFETDLFRLINDLPSQLAVVLGPVMQLGNVLAAPAVGLVAALLMRRHLRVAFDVTVSGLVAWVAAKVVKALVDRPRPGGLVEDVHRIAGTEGLGFVSGHTAVATAIVTAAAPYLPRRARRAVWVLPWTVGAARIYYGAHLPLDIVGGAALGWIIAAALHLASGAPHREPDLAEAEAVLRSAGLPPTHLARVGEQPRGSFPFEAEVGGRRQFVKLLDPEPRDRDWLYRLARVLFAREIRDEAALLDGPAQAHREAAMALLARANGARVPAIRGVQTQGDRVWVIQEHVAGRELGSLAAAERTDAVLEDLWTQVAHLREARVAHQDLVATNVLVDHDGRVWLVDFAHARTADTDRALDHDVAELLVSTAVLVGVDRAVDAAVRVLGVGVTATALPTLQPLALTPVNRSALRQRPGLLDALRAEVRQLAGAPTSSFPEVHPDPWRFAIAVGVSLGAVLSLAAVAGASDVADALSAAGLRWSGLAVLAAVAAPFAGAAAQVAAADHRVALGRMAAMHAARWGTALADGPALGDDVARAFHERTGITAGESARIRRVTGRARLVAVAGIAAVALAVSFTRSVPVEAPDELGALGLIATAAVVLQLLRPDRRRRGTVLGASPSMRAPVVLATTLEVLLTTVVAVASAAAFDAEMAAAPVVLAALAIGSVGRVTPMAGGPGLGAVLFAGTLSALGMPLVNAVAATVVFTALRLWAPMLAARPLRRLVGG